MRKLIVPMVALVFFLGLTGGCADSSNQKTGNEEPIGVRKQHDTRVIILYKDSLGRYNERSFHESAQLLCAGKIVKIKDYSTICKADRYIAFPGHEKELDRYLANYRNQED
jgi:hypothetical protein